MIRRAAIQFRPAPRRQLGRLSGARLAGTLALQIVLFIPGIARAGAEHWAIEGASLRFEAEIVQQPSDPAAGVLVELPDGGLLPRPFPEVTVVTPLGEALVSQPVWRNPARGYAVAVLVTSKVSRIWVYLRGTIQAPSETLGRGLCPSLLLFTRPGPDDLGKAARLPATLPENTDGVMGQVANICLSDNPFGPHEFFHSYFTGWIRRTKAARVYFCTVSRDQSELSELRVDGRTVATWPANRARNDGAKGQFGSWVELGAGLHHVEYIQCAGDGGKEMQAAWRIPGETAGELPVAIPESAFLHSGRCRLIHADFRDGRPAFAVEGNLTPSRYFWFGDRPVNLYELRVSPLTQATNDTTYTWIYDNDRRMVWPHSSWLFDGGVTNPVIVTAVNRAGTTKVAVPLALVGEADRGNVNNASDRAWFRAVMLGMCESTAAGHSPCARWSPDLWEVLANLAVPFEGTELFETIFTRSRRETLALDRAKRWTFEDVLIGGLRSRKPDAVPRWLDQFEKEETDPARRFAWKLERFDCTLYDSDDTVAARRIAADLQSSAVTPEQKLRALIRLGDVEQAVSNLEAAVTCYGEAQDRYHEQLRHDPAAPKPKALLPPNPASRKALRMTSTRAYTRAPDRDWKTLAVREASFYATVSSLTGSGFFFEARDTLRQWELEVPLSKLGGDYALAEAEYYLAAGNVRRALAGVRLCRNNMEISSSLPEVMDLELRCLVQLKQQREAEALAAEVLKEFPNAPAGERAKKLLGKE